MGRGIVATAMVLCPVIMSGAWQEAGALPSGPSGPASLLPSPREGTGPIEAREPANGRGDWPRVRIADPVAATVMRHALNRASRLLAEPRCQRVLVEFSDIHGCRLADKLTTLGVDIQEYLRLVIFYDGSQRWQCGEALAYTTAGSRIVFVCVGSVLRSWRMNPDYLVHSLVHEILHTLGLGENPPASQEITHRVRTLCAGEREIPGH